MSMPVHATNMTPNKYREATNLRGNSEPLESLGYLSMKETMNSHANGGPEFLRKKEQKNMQM